MRIGILGTGGVGGFFGAKLADAGMDVTFIARGEHLSAIEKNGLRIIEANRELLVKPAQVITPDTITPLPLDVIIFAVKINDTEDALKACPPLMHDKSFILTLQNGVESVELIENIIGKGRVVGGAAYIVSKISKPGVIKKDGPAERIEFAEIDGRLSERAKAFETVCKTANIDAHLLTNIQELIWRKFLLLSATSAITGLTRQPISIIRSDPDALEVMKMALDEAIQICHAVGVNLPDSIEETILFTLKNVLHGDAKASLLIDLERGKPLELDWLSGAVHRFGKKYGISTPVHSTVYAALKPFAKGSNK